MVQTTKTLSRNQLMRELSRKFPNMFLRTTEEFNGSQGGIWTSAEDGTSYANGQELFNYYSEDWKGERYILGVHKKLYNYLHDRGWYASWNDPGTVMLWTI